jgi:excisionase family DNA binding protein
MCAESAANRNSDIALLRRNGHTLSAIGARYGLTRERVRQILAKQAVDGFADLVTLAEAADRLGCNVTRLRRMIKGGELSPIRLDGARRFLVSTVQVEQLAADTAVQWRCTVCGRPLPARRRKYCSAECYERHWSYRNWSPQRKDKHRRLVERWRAEHPDKARQIRRRAGRKYQLKRNSSQ